ncbi:hypothetical protein ABZ422_02825 [Micromonospora zamorensis]
MTGTRELDARPAQLDVVSSAAVPTEATPTGAALPAVKGKLRVRHGVAAQ